MTGKREAIILKIKKRLACLLLAALTMLAAGCSAGAGSSGAAGAQTQAKGRFVESNVTPEGSGAGLPSGLYAHPDGNVDYLWYDQPAQGGEPALHHSRSQDNGATWQALDVSWQREFEGLQAALALSDGSLLLMVKTEEQGFSCWKVAQDGQKVQLELPELEERLGAGGTVIDAKLLSDDRVYLQYMGGRASGGVQASAAAAAEAGAEDAEDGDSAPADAFNVDGIANAVFDLSTGALLTDLSGQDVYQVALAGDRFLVSDYEGGLSAYSLEDGARDSGFHGGQGGPEMALGAAADSEGNFYYINTQGVYRLTPGGTLSEALMEGSRYSFGSPTYGINAFARTAQGDFLAALSLPDGSSRLMRYVYDPEMLSRPDKELTVYSLTDSSTARAAITAFQQAHSDVQVNYEVALEEGAGSQQREDALRALNTELVAGQGPDVLILDGLPFESYIDKGVLADLAGLLDTSGVIPQLVKSFETEKGLFALPTRFGIPALFTASGRGADWNTLTQLAGAVAAGSGSPAGDGQEAAFSPLPEGQRPVLSFQSWQELFELFYSANASALANRENGVDETNLRTFLEALKTISDRCGLGGESGGWSGGLVISGGTGGGFTNIPGSVMGYSNGRALAGCGEMMDLMLAQYAAGIEEGTQARLLPGLADGAWVPHALAGISEKSGQKELAAAFLETMLSHEVQDYSVGDGLPALRAGLDAQLRRAAAQEEDVKYSFGAGQLSGTDLDALLAGLKTPMLADATLKEKISAGAEACCKGELTVEAALEQIKSETALYLAERG